MQFWEVWKANRKADVARLALKALPWGIGLTVALAFFVKVFSVETLVATIKWFFTHFETIAIVIIIGLLILISMTLYEIVGGAIRNQFDKKSKGTKPTTTEAKMEPLPAAASEKQLATTTGPLPILEGTAALKYMVRQARTGLRQRLPGLRNKPGAK